MTDRTISGLVNASVRREFSFQEPLLLMRPPMPDLHAFHEMLEGIWSRRWLTNNGPLHLELEAALRKELGVEHLNILCNGTIALLLALQALRINGGEVITTPFSFPATTHVLFWNHINPVFCDIDPKTCNIDAEQIVSKITPETRAILATHVFGTPCDVEAIEKIARTHGLQVIYDAAHVFGVTFRGRPLLEWGDISALSFHATKLFSTGEGGAIVSNSQDVKRRIDYLKNFGIEDEEHVIGPGINGKMTEMQAAFGLLSLKTYRDEIAKRGKLVATYRERLEEIDGLRFLPEPRDFAPNHAYFPIFVDETAYGMSRDELYDALKELNIHARKYFYPLISDYPCYHSLQSATHERLPAARRVADQVLCLPLCGSYKQEAIEQVAAAIAALRR